MLSHSSSVCLGQGLMLTRLVTLVAKGCLELLILLLLLDLRATPQSLSHSFEGMTHTVSFGANYIQRKEKLGTPSLSHGLGGHSSSYQ